MTGPYYCEQRLAQALQRESSRVPRAAVHGEQRVIEQDEGRVIKASEQQEKCVNEK